MSALPRLLVLASLLGTSAGVAQEARDPARTPELFAERITAAAASRRQVGGPGAVAGIGDWAFGNGTLCGAISDPSHESDLSDRGAVLTDLGHCGRRDDQWSTLQPILNLSQSKTVPVTEIYAEQSDDEARIVTRGRFDGVEIETTYAVGRAEPSALRITERITRRAEGDRFFAHGVVVLHPDGAFRPFHLDVADLGRSMGFTHPGGDPSSPFSMLRSIVPATWMIWVGSPELGPEISYGLETVSATREDADGTGRAAPGFSITGSDFTMAGTMVRPFFVGDDARPGALELAQIPFMNLDLGDSLVVERRLWVGLRADVASITDRLFADEPVLIGRVDDPDAVIHFETEAGAPVSMARVDAEGGFGARLPGGRYRVIARGRDGREASAAIEHGPAAQPVSIALGTPARLVLPRGAPMRLVFLGADGTPDPVLRDDGLGLVIGGEAIPTGLTSNDVMLAGVASDPRTLPIAPGRYRVLAGRGPEYDLTETTVEVEAGVETPLVLDAPTRLFELPGWVSTDLHVHTGASFDSSLPPTAQVAAFHAAGAEVLVATEHDRVVDPTGAIRALGLQDAIAGITGLEVTSEFKGGETPFSGGHANAFPLAERPLEYRGGAVAAEGRRLRDVWHDLRNGARPLIQLNHPREKLDPEHGHSVLSHLTLGLGYDPTLPLDDPQHRSLVEPGAHGTRDLDFDAIELLNGNRHGAYERVRADWISFLLQGERITGTANSDSHRHASPVALPRNYVAVAGSLPGQAGSMDRPAFFEAVRQGALWGTTGPLLEVRLDETGLGGLHPARAGTLHVKVDAAPWVPVDRLRVYVNGVLAEERAIETPAALDLPLQFPADALVTLEVEGEPGEAYRAVAPGFRPFAFTNPIYVDADGDGSWSPPGLP